MTPMVCDGGGGGGGVVRQRLSGICKWLCGLGYWCVRMVVKVGGGKEIRVLCEVNWGGK